MLIKYLAVLSIFGLPVYIIQSTEPLESKSVEFYQDLGYEKSLYIQGINISYTILVIIWSFFFVTYWGIHEHQLAYQWGQLDYEMTENKLEGFHGVERRSPINDNLHELYYPTWKRLCKMSFSGIISIVILAMLTIVVVGLLIFRNWIIESKWGGTLNDYVVFLPSI